ncbi:MAG: hypothetical protein ACTICG_09210 [Corynebacterium casei]|uniref:hypothetical protein n=1 Tax=Corynebacterium casei TaxID=160386 RepID=UPI003F933C64
MEDKQFQTFDKALAYLFKELRYTNFLLTAMMSEEQLQLAKELVDEHEAMITLAKLDENLNDMKDED